MVLGTMENSNAGVVNYTPKSVTILHDCGLYAKVFEIFLLLKTFSFRKAEWYHILSH